MNNAMRLLLRVLGVIVVVIVAVCTFVLSRRDQNRQVMWDSSESPAPPAEFMYVVFPNDKSVSFADHALIHDEQRWGRALLNEIDEMPDSAISAFDEASSRIRFVDIRSMTFTPQDGSSVDDQVREIVRVVGSRVKGQPIKEIRFECVNVESALNVTLQVRRERVLDVYEYLIVNDKIIPKKWYRK